MTHPSSNRPTTAKRHKLRNSTILCLIAALLFLSISICLLRLPEGTFPGGDPGSAPPSAGPAESGPNAPSLDPPASFASYTSQTKEIDLELSSEYVILIDLQTRCVLAEKESQARMYPASMTKIMTVWLACERLTEEQWNGSFLMTASIINPLYEAGAALAGFSAGEQVAVSDLLYGAALPSGAECTTALAQLIAGDTPHFVDLMNQKVEELGLTHTHFANATGLHDDDHYTTAYEMAVIFASALENQRFFEIFSSSSHTSAPTNKHPQGVKMTSTVFSRIRGDEVTNLKVLAGKTGYTLEAMRCLATYAVNQETEKKYLCVCGHAATQSMAFSDTFSVYQEYLPEFSEAA